MEKLLMIVMVLIFVSGCAGTLKQVPVAKEVLKEKEVQKTDNCVIADYQSDGRVFLKVKCPGRIIHVVARLKPQSNYAVLIGDDPIRIIEASLEGIIVFENPSGKDVEMILEMSDEEMKEIKIKKGGE